MTKSGSDWSGILRAEGIGVHPAATVFRMLPDAELDELGEDIEAHGLRLPLRLWRAKEGDPWWLVDGRNRCAAMARRPDGATLIQGAIACAERHTGGDPVALVRSLNDRRRHDSIEARREAAEKLLRMDAGRSDRQIAKLTNQSPTTVGTIRTKLERAGEVSKLDSRTDARGAKRPATRKPPAASPPDLAKHVGLVSRRAYSAPAPEPAKPKAAVWSQATDRVVAPEGASLAVVELVERFAREAQYIRPDSVHDLPLPEIMELSLALSHAQDFLKRVDAALGATIAKLSGSSQTTANDQLESDCQQPAPVAETPEPKCVLPKGCHHYADCAKGWCGAAAAAGPAGRA